eukprot:5076222-Alexandrium_andersonii.AAC.1
MSASLVGSEMCIRDRLELCGPRKDLKFPPCKASSGAFAVCVLIPMGTTCLLYTSDAADDM